jgi:diadenosine tetraphosphate (Ap4A) HIT family hydrolase
MGVKQENMMDGCVFCDIQRREQPPIGGSVYEDALVYAYHADNDGEPTYLGHLMLVTKRHTPDFTELTCAEAKAVGVAIARLSRALKASTSAEKVYEYFYGEVTPHLHVILTARYPGTPAEYLRWNALDWSGAPRGNVSDIAALCERLRAALASAAPSEACGSSWQAQR